MGKRIGDVDGVGVMKGRVKNYGNFLKTRLLDTNRRRTTPLAIFFPNATTFAQFWESASLCGEKKN